MNKSIRALRLDADGSLTATALEEDARGTHLEVAGSEHRLRPG